MRQDGGRHTWNSRVSGVANILIEIAMITFCTIQRSNVPSTDTLGHTVACYNVKGYLSFIVHFSPFAESRSKMLEF